MLLGRRPSGAYFQERAMAVEVGAIQSVTEGFGFTIRDTKGYGFMTLRYKNEEAAKEGREHALKAVANATAAELPS
jgi:hypothetical protein